MKTKILTLLLVQFMALSAFAGNAITYTASEKLPETTSTLSSGLHTNAFNVAISNHTFSNGTGTITFEGDVTRIGDNAFSGCSGLTSITIPNSVTSIGYAAFWGCSGLTSITIPNSVTSIGSSVFENCSSLPIENGIRYADTYLVKAVDKTKNSYSIKEGTKWLGNSAFEGCSGLTSVTIPNSVTSIGGSAFYGCSGLTSITIPNSVTSIEDYTFSYCSGLTSITIPSSVTSIGSSAFYGCSGLTSITIPNTVTSIGSSAFAYCSGLTSIVVESGNTNYDSRDNCNAIIETSTNTLIAGCKNTVIPNSVTTIGYRAFYGCSSLTSITIPNSVTSIEGYAFSGCSGLTSITIPNSVTSIDDYAFYGCSGLTSITIPNSVTSIGKSAFDDCSGVKELTIGSLVSSIREYAFYGCKRLVTITCFATNPPTAYGNSFQYYDCNFYVPCDELRTYKRDEVFGQFENIECIGAESGETVTDVVTTPSDNTVTILWPKDDAASTYTIVITKDGITICTLTFNAAGQLMNIAFAPGRDTEMPSHAAESINGSWSFTVTGLNSGTKYEYSVTTKNSAQSVLSSYSGSFTTTGTTSLINTSIEMQTTKFFRDGQLRIIRDNKTYTVEGSVVK